MNKKLIFLAITSGMALLLLVLNTSPKDSPLPIIVIPLVLTGLFIGCVSSLIAAGLGSGSRSWRVFLPVALGILSTLFVVMTSLKQLTPATGSLLAAFVVLFVFYLSKAKK